MKVLILTTRQNHVWTSMQEIIPSLEYLWSGIDGVDSEVLNVDNVATGDLLSKVLSADKFVVTAFNLKITRAIEIIRKSIKHTGEIYFYVHNMATIGAWPLEAWGVNKLLTTNDRFIVTCENDINSMKLCYENANVLLHPFFIPDYKVKKRDTFKSDENFVFIGRISAQKNLHNLLWAFSKYRKRSNNNSKLIFFGEEDHLGSPNMGMRCDSYLKKLKETAERLNISQDVDFRGFVNREKIYNELEGEDYIFISPSLHSDENFGMAAFRSLLDGRRAILSDWGGHSDYRFNFSNQLELMPVYKSDWGPVISVDSIFTAMMKIGERESLHPHYPDYYKISRIRKLLMDDLKKSALVNERLVLSKNANHVIQVQSEHENKFSTKIFDGYEDQSCYEFFHAYGMKLFKNECLFDRNFYDLSPWCKIDNYQINISDPHKGELNVKIVEGHFPVRDSYGHKAYVDKEVVQELLSRGVCTVSNLDISTKRYEEDKCSPSISILKDKVQIFLESQKIENLYFADCEDQDVNPEKTVNVILFGGHIRRILESGCWNFKTVHFWVLSQSVKNILNNFFKIDKDCISIIEREALFNVKKVPNVKLDSGVDLVYAGRISRVKNIDLLIYTNNALQNKLNKDIKLNIIGSFDEEYHEFWGYFSNQIPYINELEEIIESLDWKFSKPVFHKKTRPSEWGNKKFNNPHYISLSTFLCEDFAVSVAQAQENGWPCILTDWGAHRDVAGACLINSNNVLPFLKRNVFLSSFSKRIASEIIEYRDYNDPAIESNVSHKCIDMNDLDRLRRSFVSKYGRGVLNLVRGEASLYSTTEKGEEFYREVLELLGNIKKSNSVLVVKDGINESRDLSFNYNLDNEKDTKLSEFSFYTASDVLKKKNLIKIMQADDIVVTFPRSEAEELANLLESVISDDCTLTFVGGCNA